MSATATSEQMAGVRVVRDYREAIHLLQDDTEIAIDLETSGLRPHADKVAVISLYGDQSSTMAVLHVRGTVPAELKAFLEEPHRRYTYHNGVAFDIPFLLHAGVEATRPKLYDTLVGAALLNSTGRHDHSVSLLNEVNRRLGVTLSKDSGGHGHWMDPQLTEQQVRYCVEDIVHIHGLRRAQLEKARETGQLKALQLENDIHAPVARMTYNGLPISLEALGAYLEQQAQIQQELDGQLKSKFGPVNFGSHVQVKKMVRVLGLVLPSTDADFLEQVVFNGPDALMQNREYFGKKGEVLQPRFITNLEELGVAAGALNADVMIELARQDKQRAEEAMDVIRKIVDLRKAIKPQNQYGDKFVERFVWELTVHSRFKQAGTDTGRFSSSDPNLQQVPRDMRWVFGHKPDWKMVSVDYSQIEVIVAAYLAQDRNLLGLVERGTDLHTEVAAQIFNVPVNTIDKKDKRRRIAKACSFTLLFGGGAQRLVDQARQEGADISLPEGKEIVSMFFKRFPASLKKRQEAYEMANSGRKMVQITLLSGLKRHLVGSNIKGTTILNTQVQGSAAAGIKNAIRLAHERGLDIYFGATVHDEITGCAPAKWADEYAAELSKTMIEGMQRYIKAPVQVEAKVGDVWS